MKNKRLLCMLVTLCLLLCPVVAGADGRVSDEMLDDWYETMRFFTEDIGTREVGTDALTDARDALMERYEALGVSYEDGTLWESMCVAKGYDLDSLVGVKPALSDAPAIVTLCAHYDSKAPGARDNSSGLAAMLTLMEHFLALPPYADTELRFVAFTAEETGHQGSLAYVEELMEDERERSLAVFNLDVLVVEEGAQDVAFSVDSMGMRTPDGYVQGSTEQPAHNKAVRALRSAMQQMDVFRPEDEGTLWCVPRHLDMSDHESFHLSGIDAVNVCFRGNVAAGGGWYKEMHTPDDVMGDFDIERTRQALEAVLIAVDGLSRDHGYGD